MPDPQQSISTFFNQTLRAPLHNNRWSWGAVHPETGQLFLRVWDDERHSVRGVPCVIVHTDTWKSASTGRPERARHVELMRNGTQAYGVVCFPDETASRGHRTIRRFETQTLLRFSGVIDRQEGVYAVIAGTVPTQAVHHRVRIPAGILR
ncbi:hypothetical protein GCM10011487_12100 [Steroidobacter agaridevorans]|uniref:Uncharacterized protein n=1 Tax=Steroidobacter agaridevorans TaxID=2695856 RepID=A0A829Y7M9_9GAMM|nr:MULTISPECIES: hypothetical protein [Steroidobacteraceae]GFE79210.1 hypothetical protein GCM10011487_12100 [Steroidobacter agaridevorans]